MNKPIPPLALFRLSVLGPLASRDKLTRGELKLILKELASKTYSIPGSKRIHLSSHIIERWYYAWLRGGIEALAPKTRCDKYKTHFPADVQAALLTAKKDNPARSLNTVIALIARQGLVAKDTLSRASVHRFLQHHQLSKRTLTATDTIERRSFVAEHVGDIWQGDVLHGPTVTTKAGLRKAYLVSLMDDTSRLIVHSAFCLSESALDIEGVLKQAILKRGLPKKLLIDNGPAYRAHSLQSICASLDIRLIYCRPYEPQGKGKLERYHRTFRELFLAELGEHTHYSLDELNARLWVWVENIYHQRPHQGLAQQTPIARFRQELGCLRLVQAGVNIDHLFYHRHKRTVRKDGTVSWHGTFYEVPHPCVDKNLILVVEPQADKALWVESVFGDNLGPVTVLDKLANCRRTRQRPMAPPSTAPRALNAVELAYQDHQRAFAIPLTSSTED